MQQTSLKEQLKKLVELQKIDGEIFTIQKDLKEKPEKIEELKQQFEEKKSKLNDLEEQLKAKQLERKEKEVELQGKEDAIVKANAQLSEIKTNKEYTAKLTEIEGFKADKSIFEEQILKCYDEADAISGDIEKEKAVLAEEEKNFQAQKKEVEEAVKEMEDRIKVLESQVSQGQAGVDPAYLDRYSKVLKHKEGLGIVPVVGGNTCGGCYMNVTPQMVNAIKMNQDLVTCEFCTRLLYLEEDLE